MITTFQFARMVAAPLRGAAILAIWPDFRVSIPYYRVTGRMDTGVVVSPVEIHVWESFSVLKHQPPAVWCRAPWMRDEADWHNSRATGICWVLDLQWRDAMSWAGKRPRAILEEGSDWLMNAVSCLINRHYTGFLNELRDWPAEWSSWGHAEKGRREYEREQRMARAGASTGRKER